MGLEKAGIEFVATDNPHANRLTVGIMALVADEERRAISARTKAALAAAKARGVKLGGNRGAVLSQEAREKGARAIQTWVQGRATDLAPVIAELREAGISSANALANALNERGIPTAKGGKWQAVQVQCVLARL